MTAAATEAEAATWIDEVAEAALAGDEGQVRLLPDVSDHYHLRMSHHGGLIE